MMAAIGEGGAVALIKGQVMTFHAPGNSRRGMKVDVIALPSSKTAEVKFEDGVVWLVPRKFLR
jgi:hypothetical protein